jgi:hypothetical protein
MGSRMPQRQRGLNNPMTSSPWVDRSRWRIDGASERELVNRREQAQSLARAPSHPGAPKGTPPRRAGASKGGWNSGWTTPA